MVSPSMTRVTVAVLVDGAGESATNPAVPMAPAATSPRTILPAMITCRPGRFVVACRPVLITGADWSSAATEWSLRLLAGFTRPRQVVSIWPDVGVAEAAGPGEPAYDGASALSEPWSSMSWQISIS